MKKWVFHILFGALLSAGVFFGGIYLVFKLVPIRLDVTGSAAVAAAVIGALGALVGSISTGLMNYWTKHIDESTTRKDRLARLALELTKMDFEIRQASISLGPVKFCREVYRCFEEYERTGKWPTDSLSQQIIQIIKKDTQTS